MASNHVVMLFLDVRKIGRKGLYENIILNKGWYIKRKVS